MYLLLSHVQHNDDCHFVVRKPKNVNVFNYTNSKTNNNNDPILITIQDVIALNQLNLLKSSTGTDWYDLYDC